MKCKSVLFFLLLSVSLVAQIQLAPSITSDTTRSKAAKIAPFKPYIDSTFKYTKSGFHIGDLVPDFTLADTSGKLITLSNVLAEGKPVLLIEGSYTCSMTRYSITKILPDIRNIYGSSINVFFIYTLEAHPVGPDHSPYSGTVSTTKENIEAKILYPQQQTYNDRKKMAMTMNRVMPLKTTILLDDCQNSYLNNYGPSPNNAYLLTPEGRVFNKYGRMSRARTAVINDIYLLITLLKNPEPEPKLQTDIRFDSLAKQNILYVSGPSIFTIELYTSTGELLIRKPLSGTPATFPLEQYALVPGNYTIRIISGFTHYQVRSFVKN